MTNAELILIKALRYCKIDSARSCVGCPLYEIGQGSGCLNKMHDDAADALEAAEKRIAELESNNPIVESVLVDKLNQRIEELENDKTNLEAEIINLEIALDKANCELEAQMPKRGARMRTVTDCHTLDQKEKGE